MRKKRMGAFLAAVWMACASIGSVCAPMAVYGAASSAVIEIGSAEEWTAFAASCSSEDATRGKRVVLTANIDLSGQPDTAAPVPVFCGTFEGNGHEISGVSVTKSGAATGLFRYVEAGAVIQNLKVKIDVFPENESRYAGGIAGRNRGTLRNCAVSGAVTSEEGTGGIVGWNEETGTVIGCRNQTVVTGNRQTGGIAGINDGRISDCSNEGKVNPNPGGVTRDQGTELQLSGQVELKNILEEEKVQDTGGIAGISSGTITGSINYGSIGCSGTGYNTGGIAGRQNGVVAGCKNTGTVEGRKDVGGIVGQFEPFMTISYHQDVLEDLDSQMDLIADIEDAISGQLRSTGDQTSDRLDEIDGILKEIRNYSRDEKDVLRAEQDAFDQDVRRKLDTIDDVLAEMELDLGSRSAERAASRIRRTVEESRALLDSLKPGYDDSDDIVDEDEAGNLLDGISDLYETLTELRANAKSIAEDTEIMISDGVDGVVSGVRNLSEDLDSLRVETGELLDLVGDRLDAVKDDTERMDQDITAKLDRLYSQVDSLSDEVKDGRTGLRQEKDRLEDQLEEIHGIITDEKDRVRGQVDDRIDDRPLFEDISDAAGTGSFAGQKYDGTAAPGTLSGNVNQGTVKADYQAGGIAGIIGFERADNPEEDIETEGMRSFNMNRYLQAVVDHCRNDGQVEARRSYAGGLVGKASFGAVRYGENYGDVSTADGNYAGGIAGYSEQVIRDCYSMCTVSGNDYAGGIAGQGFSISGNTVMAHIASEGGAYTGAVAGWTDEDGSVEENRYVEDGLGAVDGISRDGQAKAYTYEQMTSAFSLPEPFLNMQVIFMVDGREYQRRTCSYGETITLEQMPEAPEKDGYYYVWEDVDLSFVNRNIRVHAIYQPWTTVLASDLEKQPMLLAEGLFYPGTTLKAEVLEHDPAAESAGMPRGWKAARVIRYESDQDVDKTVTLHVRTDFKSEEILAGLSVNGQYQPLDYIRDGNYLVFEAPTDGTVLLLKRRVDSWMVLAVLTGLAVTALAVARQVRDGRREKPEEMEAGESESGGSKSGEALENAEETGENAENPQNPQKQ